MIWGPGRWTKVVGGKAIKIGKDRWWRHLGVTEAFETGEPSGHIYI